MLRNDVAAKRRTFAMIGVSRRVTRTSVNPEELLLRVHGRITGQSVCDTYMDVSILIISTTPEI
jgi:hypothetical protein